MTVETHPNTIWFRFVVFVTANVPLYFGGWAH